jgi:hypothetical protein
VVVANPADKTFDQANVNVDFLAADGSVVDSALRGGHGRSQAPRTTQPPVTMG